MIQYEIDVLGIVHPKMKMLCLSAYRKGIQDVGDFVSSVKHKRRFLTNRCSLSVIKVESMGLTALREKKHTQTKPNESLWLLMHPCGRSEVKNKYINTVQFLAHTNRLVSLDLNVSSRAAGFTFFSFLYKSTHIKIYLKYLKSLTTIRFNQL